MKTLPRVLAAVATVATLSILAGTSGAFAHGMGGMGGMGGNHFSGLNSHLTTNLVTTNKLTSISHDHRRFRFIRFGLLGSAGPVCVYKWTELGRVKICPADVY